MKKYKLAELFCGPGGFAEGAKQAKLFTHVWVNDIDQSALDTFSHNHPECETIHGDGSKIFNDQKMSELKKRHGSIDGLIFGFPCNDFSMVGKKLGLDGNYGGLYKVACKVLKYFQPEFFVAENVTAISSKDRSSQTYKNFKKIMTDLSNCGYGIYGNKIEFEKYSVPQTRRRLILFGVRKDKFNKINYQLPSPTSSIKFVTCKDALSKLEKKKNFYNHEFTNHKEDVLKRLKKTKQGQNVWDIGGLPNVKSARMSHIYKKLDENKPAYTVTGSGGGGTHMYHYKFDRALTNRERATLQTFPINYEFKGKKDEVRKQIGMAVPVKGAKAIMRAVAKSFTNKKKITENYDWFIKPNSKDLIADHKVFDGKHYDSYEQTKLL
jgi:DNA (cytosine-5)-methyltransferase 1